MDWHDYDLLRASGAATVHGYYGGGTAGGYHDEVGRKHGQTAVVIISEVRGHPLMMSRKFFTFFEPPRHETYQYCLSCIG